MLVKEQKDGTFVQWNGEPIDDIKHPPSIETLWSAKELKAVGLYKVEEEVQPTAGAALLDLKFVKDKKGAVSAVYTWDIPPPTDDELNNTINRAIEQANKCSDWVSGVISCRLSAISTLKAKEPTNKNQLALIKAETSIQKFDSVIEAVSNWEGTEELHFKAIKFIENAKNRALAAIGECKSNPNYAEQIEIELLKLQTKLLIISSNVFNKMESNEEETAVSPEPAAPIENKPKPKSKPKKKR